jgi:serine/threonine protein kinase
VRAALCCAKRAGLDRASWRAQSQGDPKATHAILVRFLSLIHPCSIPQFDSPFPGGSSGWQAPEQLVSRSGGVIRLGKSVDVFSFGLVLFYCFTAGRHPYGETYERDVNILQARTRCPDCLPHNAPHSWPLLCPPVASAIPPAGGGTSQLWLGQLAFGAANTLG